MSAIFKLSDTANSLVEEISKEAKPSKTTLDLAEEALIPQGIEIPKPELIFALDGIPLFTKKSLSVLKGKAKSGKTTCTTSELDAARECILFKFNRWRDRLRPFCSNEAELEAKVVEAVSSTSKEWRG